WNIGQGRPALWAGYGKCAQLAGLDQIDHRQHGDEHEGVRPVQQVADGLGKLRIGNVLRASTGLQFELFADEVGGCAEAARGKRQLVGLALEKCDKLGDRVRRHRWIDHQDIVRDGRLDDRFEIGVEAIRDIRYQRWRGNRWNGHRIEVVPVGRLHKDVVRRNCRDPTRPVLHDRAPVFTLRQFLGDDPADDVRWRARGERGNESNRAVGEWELRVG